MSNKNNKATIIPLDMRRRPLCGPPGMWENANPKPDGDEKPFWRYKTRHGSGK